MTAPLDAQIAVAGPVSARLFISSSAPDTDFTIKLVDVHPPNEDYPRGFAMNLTDGIVRCRFHASFEDPQLLTPGCVYEVEVVAPTRPISSPWAIASGSTSRRARFHASTSTPTPAGQRRRLDAPRSRPTGSTWTATTRRT
jgi:hypothetical protein